jgi:hypothetical protein
MIFRNVVWDYEVGFGSRGHLRDGYRWGSFEQGYTAIGKCDDR